MLADLYDLSLSTASAAARDAYVRGCKLALTLYPGAIAAFDRAIAADPGFALARVGVRRRSSLANLRLWQSLPAVTSCHNRLCFTSRLRTQLIHHLRIMASMTVAR